MKTIEFTEANGTKHTLNVQNLNRVEVQDRNVRIAYFYEALKFDMGNAEKAEALYNEIAAAIKAM